VARGSGAPHVRGSRGRDEPADERNDALSERFVTNILNPKVALFFLTFLPKFVRPAGSGPAQMLTPTAIFVTNGGVWLSVVGPAVGRAAAALRTARARTAMQRRTGTVLVGLGVRLAVAAR
jgi:threonine/homoserine/homoserine lactone efflux protein